MASVPNDRRRIFLSTLHAGRSDRRLALAVVLASLGIFAAAAPFAKTPLSPVQAFIPAYESALVVNDLVTAVLLLGQFNFTRSRALLFLVAGYLFTALITVAHALTFPGLFAPGGLLGAGAQSTAWIYMFWHGGFPLLVIAYAVSKRERRAGALREARLGIVTAGVIAAVGFAVFALTALATAGHALLPPIMAGNQYTTAMALVVSSVWALSVAALFVLWRSRPHSLLDVWLMVVMCAWMLDIALSAVLNQGRFDLGFYAGRIYGLLASAFVLVVLLAQNGLLYARLVRAYEGERKARTRVNEKSRELVAANQELEAFSYTVSHDLRGPLRHVLGYIALLEKDAAGKISPKADRYLGIISHSAEAMGQLIDHLLQFSRTGRGELRESVVDMHSLVQACIADLEPDTKGRETRWQVAPLPAVKGDPALLRQVWANLLSNAVKYTRGRAVAEIEIGLRGEESARPVFFVRDNGAGFDMALAGKLFGVFQRMHTEAEFEGTGIGLATVQRIVARHGGRVWAESVKGEGTTFCFTCGCVALRAA